MKRRTYNIVMNCCIAAGVASAFIYEWFGDFRWVSVAIALLSTVVAMAVYFGNQWMMGRHRKDSESDSATEVRTVSDVVSVVANHQERVSYPPSEADQVYEDLVRIVRGAGFLNVDYFIDTKQRDQELDELMQRVRGAWGPLYLEVNYAVAKKKGRKRFFKEKAEAALAEYPATPFAEPERYLIGPTTWVRRKDRLRRQRKFSSRTLADTDHVPLLKN